MSAYRRDYYEGYAKRHPDNKNAHKYVKLLKSLSYGKSAVIDQGINFNRSKTPKRQGPSQNTTSSSGSPSRSRTPQRSNSPRKMAQQNRSPPSRINSSSKFYDRLGSQPRYGAHSPRNSPPKTRFTSPKKQSGTPSTSKAPLQSDGYWTELIIRDEFGKSRPQKVWVPFRN